jgi:hypothetical protein
LIKSKYIANLTLLVFSTILILYIIEIILLKNSGYDFFNKYDFRSDIQIYKELKTENKKTFLRTNTINLLTANNNKILPIVPLSGISKSQIIMCNEGGFWATYFSDRYGFNNPDFVWDSNEIDVVLIGDSFTEGACVNENDTISANLRKISNFNVINLGRAGTGSLSHLAILKEYLPKKTKRILWIYYENDVTDLENEQASNILNEYLVNENFTQNLINKQNFIDQILFDQHKKHIKYISDEKKSGRINGPFGSFNTDKFSYLKLYSVRSFITERYFFKKNELVPTKKNISDFRNIITIVDQIAKKNDIKFYFVYISSRQKYSSKLDGETYPEIVKIIANLNVPFIDLHKSFMEYYDPLSFFPFRRQLHYNEKGYKFVSEKIYQFIKLNE